MRKTVFAFFALLAFASPVHAEEPFADADVYRAVYENIENKYITPLSAVDAAVMAVKALSRIDKNLRVADDETRVTLYYKAKVVRSFLKPENKNDVAGAVRLTGRILDAAKKVSAKTAEKDFDIADIILEEGLAEGLDGDSKYYPQFGDDEKGLLKNKRHFAARMMDNILYIKILAFNKYTMENLNQTLTEYPEFSGIILDLRGSPGGIFTESLKAANVFLDEGIVASSRDRADKTTYYTSFPGDKTDNKPLVILVDGGTTSSAEVIAAGLQEQGRAEIIGTVTYGKGTMQELVSLPNGAELGLTTAYLYTPSEKAINKTGVMPDICTFNIDERKDISAFIKQKAPADCPREARGDKNFDIEAAIALIKQKL